MEVKYVVVRQGESQRGKESEERKETMKRTKKVQEITYTPGFGSARNS